MKAPDEHIERLIASYLSGEISAEEKEELYRWVTVSAENKKIFMEYVRNLLDGFR